MHHNKEVTLKLQVEVSNINGSAPGSGQGGQSADHRHPRRSDRHPPPGRRDEPPGRPVTARDKQNTKNGDPVHRATSPIIGRLLSNDDRQRVTTDLILTLTPHIIRIPDITEEDLTPVWVGTDANISYQGTPRVENPNRDQGPFEPPAGGRTPPNRQQPPGQQPPVNPGINLAPGSAPTDIFKPAPVPQAPPPQSDASSRRALASRGGAVGEDGERSGGLVVGHRVGRV